ncbi:MAG TPA: rhodanese-like domain-containing protein [Vicinamibacterales bacterium]|jgi:rhodanese-related sulfurtransferase
MPVQRISKEDLRQRLEGDAAARPTILDVRLKYPYEHSTILLPGAIRMAPGSIDSSRIPRNQDVVAYDSDPDEISSSGVATELIKQGYRVSVLAGGIAAWAGANFPTESKTAPKPSPPAAAAKA